MRTFILLLVFAVAQGIPFHGEYFHESFPDSHEDSNWEDNSGSFENIGLAEAALEGWENAAFDYMNKLRARGNMPPLVYNQTVAAGAQEWADQIACNAYHTPQPWSGFNAENLAGLYMNMDEEERAKDGVKRWYDEYKKYTCAPLTKTSGNPYYNDVGHYVNMMRKDTHAVGFGMATCKDNPTEGQLVARFYSDSDRNWPLWREQLKKQGMSPRSTKGMDISAFVPCPNDFKAE